MEESSAPSSRGVRSLELLHGTTDAVPDSVKERLHAIRALYADDLGALEQELGLAVQRGVSPAKESAEHLVRAGGKRVRPLTVILSAACFGPPGPSARSLAVVSELVHLATLLHDDVVDDGRQRRGEPASRLIWGNAVSVLAGDMLLTDALERTAALDIPSVLTDLFGTLRRLVDGEVLQLAGRAKLDADEPTYFRVVRDKTGSLFEWAARSGAVSAGAPEPACRALGTFGARMGVAFQLVDDVLDYAGDPVTTGKTLLTDLREGKLTLPLIRTLRVAPRLRDDVEAIRQGDFDAALRVAESVRRSGICEAVRSMAREESDRALEALAAVPAGDARELLGAIARELSGRVS